MFKRLGKMNMVVESCGLMVQNHDCNPPDPCMGSVSYPDAFKQLKHALILAPVLVFPSFSKQFSVYVQPV